MRVQYQSFLAPNIISLLKSHPLPEPPSDAEMDAELRGIERLEIALKGNLPDGCLYPSDIDADNALNGPWNDDADYEDDYWERVDEALEELKDGLS